MPQSKSDRFQEFLRRLGESPAVGSHALAFKMLCDTLNAVEDELTDIPFQPTLWQTDGRMYPPAQDNQRPVEERNDVLRYRSKGHNTFVRDNGAFEIQNISGKVLFTKPGSDGRGVELQSTQSKGDR